MEKLTSPMVVFVLPSGESLTTDSSALRRFADNELQTKRERTLMEIAFDAGWNTRGSHVTMQHEACKKDFFEKLPHLIELKN